MVTKSRGLRVLVGIHGVATKEVDRSLDDGSLIVEPSVPRYTLDDLLSRCDPGAPITVDDRTWIDSVPVGNEIL